MRTSLFSKIILPSFAAGLLLGAAGMGIAAVARGSAIFSDVPEGSFFDEAVGEMYNAGIIKGYTNGNFGPNDFVTRGQVAVMMQRLRDDLLGSGGIPSSSSSSSSSSQSSSSSSASSATSSSVAATSINGAFALANATFSLPETVPALTLSVQRTGGSKGDVSVRYTIRGGTAAAGDDFGAANESVLNFRDGETRKTFTVTIKDDKAGEGSETVIIELSGPTGGAVLGSPSTATLTILDNEAPSAGGGASASSVASQASGAGTIGFSALTYEVLEGAAGINVTVVRTGGSAGQVSADYSTADKTARAGSEYQSAAGTVTFASGETSKTFNVPILDDMTVDGKKALILKLTNVTGGATLGTTTVDLNIADNEIGTFGTGSFLFSKGDFDATEGDGIATLTVSRVGGTLHTAGVSYATAHGSALPGQDFVTTSGTLTFAPGEQSKSFTVAILRDSTFDSGEYFTVNLNSPTGGAKLSDPSSAVVNVYE